MLDYLESRTFDSLINEMLARVPNDVAKEEGEVIYDAIAPTAMELAALYADLAIMLKLIFAHSSDGDYLTWRVAEHGVYREVATYAIRKILITDSSGNPFDNLPIGQMFRLNKINYIITEKNMSGEYKAQASIPGKVGNIEFGQLLPIEPIENLGSAILSDVLIPGEDEESDAELYQRFLETVKYPATSGNKAHYKIWATEVAGVGDVKVIPTWAGAGTVKVVVMNSEKRAASTELIENVYKHIEENRPIGATVTVVSATEKALNVSATVVLANGFNIGQVQSAFKEALVKHFADLAFKETYVSYARVGNLLLDIPGVGDYSNLRINNGTANVMLNSEEIPVLGTVTLGV